MKNIILSLSSLLFIGECTAGEINHTKHWGYENNTAPKHWSTLSKDYILCKQGNQQSPIDIIANSKTLLPKLGFAYNKNATSIINNGHTVQVNIQAGNSIIVDGFPYELKQFHFHTPSENNINGKSYPLEAHFVHASQTGKLAVVAVMFEIGKTNPTLKKLWKHFPLEENKSKKIAFTANDIKSLLPKDRSYYKFTGSLTTPPCTEEVKWNVFKVAITVSKEQVDQFFAIFNHKNNRPIQEKNKRIIFE